jgi:ABC-2 type transport system permease protein
MGKIIGIALVGLTQFILWVGLTAVMIVAASFVMADKYDPAAIAEMRTSGTLQPGMEQKGAFTMDDRESEQFVAEVLSTLPRVLGLFLFFFIGGYLLYSSLFAAIGAAVDNETDSQQFMLPVTLPMVIALLISELAVVNPDGPAVVWCSLIPFTSPVVMMIRVATGNAFDHPWQLAFSMILLVATFILTTWMAGRIYRTGILMYGKKVSWRELGKWLFYRG